MDQVPSKGLCEVIFFPGSLQVQVHPGTTILEVARSIGLVINAQCGGQGRCKGCRVLIGPDRRGVLACQYQIDRDLEVYLPQQVLADRGKVLTLTPAGSADPWCEPTASVPAGAYGIACDVGTTTIAASIHELATGRELAAAAAINPQAAYGADVITRIHHASTSGGRLRLQQVLIDCLDGLLRQLVGQAGVRPQDVRRMVVVGNTAMTHLLAGLPVEQLGQAPYKAFSLEPQEIPASKLGIGMAPEGIIYVVDGICGFVGADTTAVALAVGIDRLDQATLVLDVGTNGEILLKVDGGILATSCAAGPAFEGASIHHGSRAIPGAVERAWIEDGQVRVGVVGQSAPRSICGSGLVDLVACLLDLGLLDRTGRLRGPGNPPSSLPAGMAARLIWYEGLPAFVVGWDPDGEPVILTQADVRQVQLAKAAVRTGVELLLEQCGIEASGIAQILLAGAFGNYISVPSAVRIGLLPTIDPARVRAIGNAALAGARMILLSDACRRQASALARRIRYVEIAGLQQFQSVFASAMPLERM